MRHAWIFVIIATVFVLVACRQQDAEPVTTSVPKGWARAASLDRGNWKTDYNFELMDALKEADAPQLNESSAPAAPKLTTAVASKVKKTSRRLRKVARLMKPAKKKANRNSAIVKASLVR